MKYQFTNHRYNGIASLDSDVPPKQTDSEIVLKARETVKQNIKACILTRKDGIPISEIRDEYMNLTGEDIPFFKLGYNSLFHLIHDIKEITSSRNEFGQHVVIVKAKPPVNEIKKLIIVNNPSIDNKKILTDPIIGTSQLIGDDFFLQLCIKYLPATFERKNDKARITLGTVQSGMSISKAVEILKKADVISNKIVINLGAIDIYRQNTTDEMIKNYFSLLDLLKKKFSQSPRKIVVCTIPPLGNINIRSQIGHNLMTFNDWIRKLARIENHGLLDLAKEFSTDLFDHSRMVSGTPHPLHLWNYNGRQKAMKLLLNV